MKVIKKNAATSRKERSGNGLCLPIHIWVDIFLRLPAEFIVTVLCVCKEWYRIVTNPSFKNLFLQKSDENYVIYLGEESFGLVSCKTLEVVSNYNYPNKEFHHMWIVGSVDGFLCLSDKEPLNPIYLVNPSIQKYIAISSSAIRSTTVDSVIMLGFGFHEPSKDYKIVRFVETRVYQVESDSKSDELEESQVGPDQSDDEENRFYEVQTDVEVYSLSTNSWKEIDIDEFPWSAGKDDLSSFVLNERLHWLAFNNWEVKTVILTFHLGLELLEEINLPADYRAPDPFVIADQTIGVIKGCLSVCVYGVLVDRLSEHFSIYMMMDYGVTESWSKMYLTFPEVIRRCIGFTGYDHVIMESIQQDVFLDGKGEFNQLQIPEKRFLLQVAAYKESLVLLDVKKGSLDDHKDQSSEICLIHEKCDCRRERAAAN